MDGHGHAIAGLVALLFNPYAPAVRAHRDRFARRADGVRMADRAGVGFQIVGAAVRGGNRDMDAAGIGCGVQAGVVVLHDADGP